VDARQLLVVGHEKRNPAIEDLHLDHVAGLNQPEVVVLDRIASILVAVDAAEVQDVLIS